MQKVSIIKDGLLKASSTSKSIRQYDTNMQIYNLKQSSVYACS